ncbi:MAG: hypothetical protein AB4426_13845 [Xenococcaceae cyanobacterium]
MLERRFRTIDQTGGGAQALIALRTRMMLQCFHHRAFSLRSVPFGDR